MWSEHLRGSPAAVWTQQPGCRPFQRLVQPGETHETDEELRERAARPVPFRSFQQPGSCQTNWCSGRPGGGSSSSLQQGRGSPVLARSTANLCCHSLPQRRSLYIINVAPFSPIFSFTFSQERSEASARHARSRAALEKGVFVGRRSAFHAGWVVSVCTEHTPGTLVLEPAGTCGGSAPTRCTGRRPALRI